MSIISLGCEAPQPTFDVARRANEEVLQLDFAEAPVTAAAHAMPTRQFTEGNQSVLTWPASAGRTQELLTELLAAGIPF